MAKHREPVKPVEHDTDPGDSTEPESDSETEKTQTTPYSQFPSQQEALSSDEEEEDSESDSDPTRKSSNGARKPRSMLASAGIRDEPGKSSNSARKLRSKPVSTGQRPEEENGTDGKKLKRVEPDASEKKSGPHRVWSDDDVIVILKGMVDYSAKKKADPVADLDSFLHSIKENLHFDVTRRKLHDKIRRLKGKYQANKKKERKGREIILPNPHEQTAYELSKIIWGKKNNENRCENVSMNATANESSVRRSPSKRKGDDKASPVAKRAKIVEEMMIANAKANENVVRRPQNKRKAGDRAFPVAKTVEEMVLSVGDKLFENEEQGEEWNKLKLEDMEIYLRHLEVKTKQTKLVIGRFKSGVF